jgi:MFS transporter, putative metabolite transport protein
MVDQNVDQAGKGLGTEAVSIDDLGRWPTGRSAQAYIDEIPSWGDGTPVGSAPMTAMQKRIWSLAAAGKFFEGIVVFMTGVALPLISKEFHVSAVEHGFVSAASLFGILVGAVSLGGLSDRFGRRAMFIIESFFLLAFLVLLVWSPSFPWLVICLFGVGLALGCDYPTAHLMISESIPSYLRGRLVLGAFGFQAVGALAGTAIGFLVLKNMPELRSWRWMYAAVIIPSAIVAAWRFAVTESAPWLLHRGDVPQAAGALTRLLRREPRYPREVRLGRRPEDHAAAPGYSALFHGRTLRATILASVPWFLQDLGTYGIGIFTPTILASTVGHKVAHARNVADLIGNDELAAKGAALIDVLLILGILAAIFLADRVGRIKLQVAGFIGCALGLLIASFSAGATGAVHLVLIFGGFMLFNFMTNMGPNAQTYLIAGEVFPTQVRGQAAGLSAGIAKVGAVSTAFLFPVLLGSIGTRTLLLILVGTSLLGALVTWTFRIETAGVSLDEMGHEPAATMGTSRGRRPLGPPSSIDTGGQTPQVS